MENNQPNNVLTMEQRMQKMEEQIEIMDRILSSLLPPGAKLFTVEGKDVLYVPFMKQE